MQSEACLWWYPFPHYFNPSPLYNHNIPMSQLKCLEAYVSFHFSFFFLSLVSLAYEFSIFWSVIIDDHDIDVVANILTKQLKTTLYSNTMISFVWILQYYKQNPSCYFVFACIPYKRDTQRITFASFLIPNYLHIITNIHNYWFWLDFTYLVA